MWLDLSHSSGLEATRPSCAVTIYQIANAELAAIWLFTAMQVHAQSGSSGFSGTANDATGAVIPDAQIGIADEAAWLQRSGEADETMTSETALTGFRPGPAFRRASEMGVSS